MSLEVFVSGAIIGVMLAAPVGPLALICIHRTVTRGTLHGFVSGLGIATADAFYAGIVASGLTLISEFILAYQVPLRIIAGALLLFIGYRLFCPPADTRSPRQNGDNRYLHEYSSMTALTLANVFTIASIGIFLSGSGIVVRTASPLAGIVFGGGVFAGELIWWLAVCSALGSINHRLNPGRLLLINKISGCVIALTGIVMIVSVALL
jgi:threonine/homoserine/homoserine lactone efflux protein